MRDDAAIAWALAAGYIGVALVTVVVGIIAWRRREVTVAGRHLALAMIGSGAWALADAVPQLARVGVLPVSATRVGILAVLPPAAVVTLALWCLGRAVAAPDWRPGRRTTALLAVHPVTMTVLAVIDPWTGAIMTAGPRFTDHHGVAWTPGWAFWAHITFSYVMVSAAMAGLVRTWAHGSRLQRRQAGALLLAGMIPLPANVAAIVLLPSGAPELTGLALAVTTVIDALALLRYRLGSVVPIARSLVFRRLHDAVLVIDPEGRLIDVNDAGERMLRALDPALDLTDVRPEILGRLLTAGLADAPGDDRAGGEYPGGERSVELSTGPAVLDVRTEPLVDRRGHLMARLVVVRDVSELHHQRDQLGQANERLREQVRTIDRLREHLAELALHDELTGLHNRRHLLARLEEDVTVARLDGTDLCVALIDVDHFKSVNDQHGHAIGDALLVAIARSLADGIHGAETLARYGGEEFVALLPGTTSTQAMARAQEWRLRCGALSVPARLGPVSRTISIGLTTLRTRRADDEPVARALLQEADEALYEAKAAGRNRVVLATATRRVASGRP